MRCSPGHPFRVHGRGWVTAGELEPGSSLVDATGAHIPVDAVIAAEGSQVFNLHVEGHETFFVSERDVLVHNKPQRAKVEAPELVEARAVAEPRLNELETRAQRAIERAQAEPADTPGRAEMIDEATQLKERVAQIHDDVALAESEAQVKAQEAPERAAAEDLNALENRLRLGRFSRARAAARKSLGELRERMKAEDFRKLDGETRAELEGEMRTHEAEGRRIEADTEAVEGDPSLADIAADEWEALNRKVQDLTKEVGDAINPPSGTTIPRPHLNYPKNMLPTEGVRYQSPGPGEVVQAPEGGGYLDNQGRVWQVDRTKARVGKFFEWDVQTPDGGHINVGSDGNITH
jgi:hypothetical protein